MTGLRIAPKLTLPIEAVTETFAVLGKRGVGKSHTASVLAEELLNHGSQVVVLDPLDGWWGLRSSADGKKPGVPIYVFGGEHADLPLEATAGELLADVVVDHNVSVVLSLRHLSKAKQRQFVAAFCERLYHRKGEPAHRTPLHVVIDEADAFVPQRVTGEAARTHGAVDDLVRRGRSSGIGVTLISQRAAVISKDVLTQAEVLIALRTISPQDRKALDAWVEAHDAHDQRGPFMDSLASLGIGEAWVWSPGWLDLFQRVKIRQRRTFDSSATPTAGRQAATPAKRATVDLEQLGERIAETKEQAKANDPRELRRQVAELQRELAKEHASTPEPPEPVIERVEVPVVPDTAVTLLESISSSLAGLEGQHRNLVGGLEPVLDELRRRLNGAAQTSVAVDTTRTRSSVRPTPSASRGARGTSPRGAGSTTARGARPTVTDADVQLKAGARRILATLARQHPVRLTRSQLGVLAKFKITGGTFLTYMSTLRRHGLIDETGGDIGITETGWAYLDETPAAPLTAEEVLEQWRRGLKAGARRMLDELVDAWPGALTRDELAERIEMTPTGGTFSTYLSTLRRNHLVYVDGDVVSADEDTLLLLSGEHQKARR